MTTVVNLRGTPTFFDWKRRIQTGELIGPTIYTAGEFIIGPHGPTLFRESGERVVGPNVNTEDDVRREIARQVGQGVDVIKFYGGLPLPAYLTMVEAARAAGIPLVGHGPDNLGFDAWLQARQPLAHIHSLLNLYFLPVFSNIGVLFWTAVALAVLIGLVVSSGLRAIVGRSRHIASQRFSGAGRLLLVTTATLLAGVLAVWIQAGIVPFDTVESATSFMVVTACAVVAAILAITLVVLTVNICHNPNTSKSARVRALLASTSAIALGSLLAVFWAPIAWRSTDGGIDWMASRLHDAGVPIVSTLLTFTNDTDRVRLASDPAMDYVLPAFRVRWRQLAAFPGAAPLIPEFLKRVTRALHRANVRLIAGTDALGAPLMIPGASLHYELRSLTKSGLTPYEALRSATVNPAVLLRRDQEFGTIAVGKRADLLLVENNPLQDLAALKEPVGVMVRGHWLTREQLQQKLRSLLVNRP